MLIPSKYSIKRLLLIALGHFFVLLGAIGIFLPILPTTPFIIIALALYANNSPKCHQLLLENRWFGEVLKQWQENKTVSRLIKYRASLFILLSFSLSIFLLQSHAGLQIMLLTLAIILLFFIWRLNEG